MKGIISAALLLLCCAPLLGADSWQKGAVSLTADRVAENIYMVTGGIANTGFVVTPQGVIAVDAEIDAETARKMMRRSGRLHPGRLRR